MQMYASRFIDVFEQCTMYQRISITILHHPYPSIAYNTIHHSLHNIVSIILITVRFIVMLGLLIRCLLQCSTTITSYTFGYIPILSVYCLCIVLLYIHPIDASPSIRHIPSIHHILFCCCRYGRIIAPSHIRFVSMVLIHPFICLSSIIFLSSIDPSIHHQHPNRIII